MKTKKIIGLMRNIPILEKSHNRAYCNVLARLLDCEIEYKFPSYDTDITYLYININFSGTFNLFNGIEADVVDRLQKFLDYTGELFILEHEIEDIGDLLKSRIGNSSTDHRFDEEFLNKLSEKWKSVKTIHMKDFVKDKLVIGDSHSIGAADNGVPVFRLDGKTLYGALKDDFIDKQIPDSVKELKLVFGSIDIRHHLFRQEDPYSAARALYDNYFDKVKSLQEKGIEVTIFSPVPVETESRKMANITMYKKTPFYGSREERLALTKYVIQYMKDNAPCTVETYPEEWYDMDPVQFEEQVMEKPRGVHIGWPCYKMNDFGKNILKESSAPSHKGELFDEW